MRFSFRLTSLLLPSIVLAWSCATSPDLDPTSDIDKAIPELDASWSPTPKEPSAPLLAPDPLPAADAAVEAAAPEPLPLPLTPLPLTPMPRAARGDVVLTEVMYDPSGPEPASEWIEIWNGASSARSLSGLTLRDGAERTHVIGDGVVVEPNAYVVLARSRDAAIAAGVPANAIVYEYGTGVADNAGVLLANGASGAITLLDGANEITSCAYGGYQFADPSGRSAQLSSGPEGWCIGAATPGAENSCATP